MNKLNIKFKDGSHKIVLEVGNVADWPAAEFLAGKVVVLAPGVFEYAFSIQNMTKIYQTFTGEGRPVVIGGQKAIDALRNKHALYNKWRADMKDVMARERYPVEPNGKFVPYAHQTKIIGVTEKHPYAAVFADCLLPGTRVKLNGEYSDITSCTSGSVIETLYGKSTVFRTTARDYSGKTVSFKTSFSFFPISVTETHRFYGIRRSMCVIPSRGKNTFCSTLCDRKCPLPCGSQPRDFYKIESVYAKDLNKDFCLLFPVSATNEEDCGEFSDEYLKIVGYWIAEGWFKKKSGTPHLYGIELGFNKLEKDTLVSDAVESAKALGLNTYICNSPSKPNVTTVGVNSSTLAKEIYESCGEYSDNKTLPTWFSKLSRRQQILLLRCYFLGDGHFKTKYSVKNGDRSSQHIRSVTVSSKLACGIRDALHNLGIRSSSLYESAKIDKNGVNHKECYRIMINRSFTPKFGMSPPIIRKNKKQVIYEEGGRQFIMLPVKGLALSEYSGKVYNLTSSGHDSYLTDSGISQNCGTGKTGSSIRAIELALERGEVQPGKVLISAPLSVLYTSWVDDISKFSNLRHRVLWTPVSNKTVLSETEFKVCDLGPKPEGALTYKTKKASRYVRNGTMKAKPTTLDFAAGPWTKCQVTFKEATMLDGSKIEFGEVIARESAKENTKELFIKEALADKSTDIFIINHDGVRIYENILKEHEFDWVIVDESTKIKSIESQVTQAHIDISWKCSRRNVLTGTPNPNGFLDLWSQFYFLDRGLTLSTRLADYRNEYFVPVKIGRFGGKDAVKWNLRSIQDRDRLIEHVRKTGIFIDQRDCVDLPPRTDMKRIITLTEDQSKAYREMENNLYAEILHPKGEANIQIEAKNLLSKIMRLRQITAGFTVSTDEKITQFAKNPKLDELEDFLEELGDKKLVVVCQFKEEIRAVLERFESLGVAAIYGDVSVSDRTDSIRSFQSSDKIRVMVLQAQAAAHGITLTEAQYMVFLSLDYNFEYYYQVGKRIERIGQKYPMFVNYFLARTHDNQPTIDEDLLQVLHGKSRERTMLFEGNQDFVETAQELSNKILARIQSRNIT